MLVSIFSVFILDSSSSQFVRSEDLCYFITINNDSECTLNTHQASDLVGHFRFRELLTWCSNTLPGAMPEPHESIFSDIQFFVVKLSFDFKGVRT